MTKNLESSRGFYQCYPEISQALSAKFEPLKFWLSITFAEAICDIPPPKTNDETVSMLCAPIDEGEDLDFDLFRGHYASSHVTGALLASCEYLSLEVSSDAQSGASAKVKERQNFYKIGIFYLRPNAPLLPSDWMGLNPDFLSHLLQT